MCFPTNKLLKLTSNIIRPHGQCKSKTAFSSTENNHITPYCGTTSQSQSLLSSISMNFPLRNSVKAGHKSQNTKRTSGEHSSNSLQRNTSQSNGNFHVYTTNWNHHHASCHVKDIPLNHLKQTNITISLNTIPHYTKLQTPKTYHAYTISLFILWEVWNILISVSFIIMHHLNLQTRQLTRNKMSASHRPCSSITTHSNSATEFWRKLENRPQLCIK